MSKKTEKCSAEVTTYTPFIMGGNVNQTSQCVFDSEVIVKEILTGQTMPLCKRCLIKFWKLNSEPGDTELYKVEEIG